MTRRRYYLASITGSVIDAEVIEGKHAAAIGTAFHPVVVIDPTDCEQVERLCASLLDIHWYGDTAAMQAALREFTKPPKPPKPAEPTGLGAVVEDADGEKWIKVYNFEDDHTDDRRWARHGAVANLPNWRNYASIDAVRVLSEGVPES